MNRINIANCHKVIIKNRDHMLAVEKSTLTKDRIATNSFYS